MIWKKNLLVALVVTIVLELFWWLILAASMGCVPEDNCNFLIMALYPILLTFIPVFLIILLIVYFVNKLRNK